MIEEHQTGWEFSVPSDMAGSFPVLRLSRETNPLDSLRTSSETVLVKTTGHDADTRAVHGNEGIHAYYEDRSSFSHDSKFELRKETCRPDAHWEFRKGVAPGLCCSKATFMFCTQGRFPRRHHPTVLVHGYVAGAAGLLITLTQSSRWPIFILRGN